jgi:hypothetical protein
MWLAQGCNYFAILLPSGAAAGVQGAALDESYSLAALALALHEVPRAWAQQARKGPRAMALQVKHAWQAAAASSAAFQAVQPACHTCNLSAVIAC